MPGSEILAKALIVLICCFQLYKNQTVRVVFMLGVASDAQHIEDNVWHESQQYEDIIKENFTDTYYNLTYKGKTLVTVEPYHHLVMGKVVALDVWSI